MNRAGAPSHGGRGKGAPRGRLHPPCRGSGLHCALCRGAAALHGDEALRQAVQGAEEGGELCGDAGGSVGSRSEP